MNFELYKLFITNYNNIPKKFRWNFDYAPIKGDIPEGVKELTYSSDFHLLLNKNNLPSTLEILSFYLYNTYELTNVIPNTIKKLHIDSQTCKINSIKPGDIPYGVQEIIFYNNFNNNTDSNIDFVSNIIPNSVTHLELGYPLINEINSESIPNSVTYLKLYDYYNYPLKKGDIPNSVKYLTLSFFYNGPINNEIIPYGVIEITFGQSCYTQIKKGDLPESIKKITINNPHYNEIDTNDLPSNLYEIIVDSKYSRKIINHNNILIGRKKTYSEFKIIKYDNINITKYNDNIDYFNIKLIGKIIYEELVKKIFHPKRLLKICDTYNIELIDLVELY